MEWLVGIEEQVAAVDAALRPIAEAPVDVSDPDWVEKTRQRPDAMDEAGVRTEAESAAWDPCGTSCSATPSDRRVMPGTPATLCPVTHNRA